MVCWSLESRAIQQLGEKLAGREMQFSWRVLPGASIDIKKHIQEYLNSEPPESFDEEIIFKSIFNASIPSYI